ncbi:MAG: hypothetical protein ACE5EH_05220 [Gammaproteobacteria bacterium]
MQIRINIPDEYLRPVDSNRLQAYGLKWMPIVDNWYRELPDTHAEG